MLNLRWRDHVFQVAGSVKALLAIALTGGLALADFYDAVPLQPLLTQLLGEHAAGKLTLLLPIFFATLRYVSTNQVKWQTKEPF